MSEWEPWYQPDLNEELGGTVHVDQYRFPVDLPAADVYTILDDQTNRLGGRINKRPEWSFYDLHSSLSPLTYRLSYPDDPEEDAVNRVSVQADEFFAPYRTSVYDLVRNSTDNGDTG